MDTIVLDLIRRQESLAGDRATLESQWQEIAELVQPLRGDFTLQRNPGEKRTQKLFDGTAALAVENLAAGLWGMITNSANDWFALRSRLDESDENDETRIWLDEVTRRMRDAFGANGQRFYSRVMELYADLVTFGTGIFYVEENRENGEVHYSCRHLAECFIAENDREEVDTVYRRFQFSARQAHQKWGEKCSPAVQRALEKEPERRFPFLHAVMPRADASAMGAAPRGRIAKSMPFASYYIDIEGRVLLDEGGYMEFPYQVPRWSTASRGTYGDSPAMLALPDIKMLNAMSKTTIVAAQKAVDPPLLAVDESAVRGIRTHPGGIIYGGLDENGRRRYEPLHTAGNVNLGLDLEEQRRKAVREAFFYSLLQMVEQPNQTATEVLARQEEKLRLIGPHLGRIQSEFLDPLIRRQFGIMSRAGMLPKPSKQLAKAGIKIDYVSPLARAQKAGEGAAITRALEALAPLGAVRPTVYDNLDSDAIGRTIMRSFGVPTALLVDQQNVEAQRKSSGGGMANMLQGALQGLAGGASAASPNAMPASPGAMAAPPSGGPSQ
ncbi:MAG TPA: portal protein [Dongiaceae bacterium]|jgi:hypothetical protein